MSFVANKLICFHHFNSWIISKVFETKILKRNKKKELNFLSTAKQQQAISSHFELFVETHKIYYANRTGCDSPSDHVETEHKCGRPLGLSFNKKTGHLYIADAYMGLLEVGSEGGLATPLAKQAQGIPLKFTNGVDVDQSTGVVYLTDSSKIFQRR